MRKGLSRLNPGGNKRFGKQPRMSWLPGVRVGLPGRRLLVGFRLRPTKTTDLVAAPRRAGDFFHLMGLGPIKRPLASGNPIGRVEGVLSGEQVPGASLT